MPATPWTKRRHAHGEHGKSQGRVLRRWHGWVKLVVQDTGHGIDPAIQERIFEPFFSTKERGTGLGLAVVRQIVEGLGGRIQMTSKPGEGTRMEVFLRSYGG